MKKMLTMLTVCLAFAAGAQRGMLDNAVGVRLGLGNGATFQHFFTNKNVIEIMAYQRFGGANVTVLGEQHYQMFDVKGLKWYFGGGAHAWLFNKTSVLQEGRLGENNIAVGVDGMLGLAYYLRGIPLQFSVDWKPGFNLRGSRYIEWDGGGLSLRYRF